METNSADIKIDVIPGGGSSGSAGGCQPLQGVFLPFTVLILSVMVVLGWELYLSRAQSAVWKKQLMQRQQMVTQSRTVQNDLQKIAADLLAVGATDPVAQALADKYQIRPQSDPTPGARPR